MNLIGNAIKFTHEGHVVLDATGSLDEDGRLTLRIEVTDTGIGIPADRLDRLFKTFSQIDSSTTRHYGGTGLGLSIVKRLAELMGGDVGVRSEPGRGSSFWVTLKVDAVLDAGAARARRAGPAHPHRRRPCRQPREPRQETQPGALRYGLGGRASTKPWSNWRRIRPSTWCWPMSSCP